MKLRFIFSGLTLFTMYHVITGLQCYYCDNGQTEEDCTKRIDTCAIDQNVCYTEVRNTSEGRVSIKKSCYQNQACQTLNQQNGHSCPAVCALCCTGELCNKRGPDFCTCTLPTQAPSLIGRIQSRKEETTVLSKTEDPCSNLPKVDLKSPRFNCAISESVTILGECTSTSSIQSTFDRKDFIIADPADQESFLQCLEMTETTTARNPVTRGREVTVALELSCISRNYNTSNITPFTNTNGNLEGLTIYCQNIGFSTKEYACTNKETTLRCFVAYDQPQRSMLSSAVTEPNFLQSPFKMPTTTTVEQETTIPTTAKLNITSERNIGDNVTVATVAIARGGITLEWWIFVLIGLAVILLLLLLARLIYFLYARRGIYHVNKVSPLTTETSDDINTGEIPG